MSVSLTGALCGIGVEFPEEDAASRVFRGGSRSVAATGKRPADRSSTFASVIAKWKHSRGKQEICAEGPADGDSSYFYSRNEYVLAVAL